MSNRYAKKRLLKLADQAYGDEFISLGKKRNDPLADPLGRLIYENIDDSDSYWECYDRLVTLSNDLNKVIHVVVREWNHA